MNKQEALNSLVWSNMVPHGWERDINMCVYRKDGEVITDKEVYLGRRLYTCAVCGHGPDRDMRHLTIDCFYAVDEVSPKFSKNEDGYTLRLCKGCRARLLFHHLATFIDEKGRLAEPNLDADGNLALVIETTGLTA